MKKKLCILLLCLGWICSITIQAQNIPNNEIWYEASEKLPETRHSGAGGLHMNSFNTTISSHKFENGKGVIRFNGNVTKIGSNAFYYSDELISVTVPSSVTIFGICAFYQCSKLSKINVPKSVTKIDHLCFGDCTSLKSINIPSSVEIVENAFKRCKNLVINSNTSSRTINSSSSSSSSSRSKRSSGSSSNNLCSRCSGSGTLMFQPCPFCGGTGRIVLNVNPDNITPSNGYISTPTTNSTESRSSVNQNRQANPQKKWKNVTRIVDCPQCYTGSCTTCNGQGWYNNPFGTGTIKCPNCDPGHVGKCSRCHGTGKIEKIEQVWE